RPGRVSARRFRAHRRARRQSQSRHPRNPAPLARLCGRASLAARREQGVASMIVAYHHTPVGKLALVSNGEALVGIYFEQHKPGGVPKEAKAGADKITDRAARALDAYFKTGARGFDLPIAFKGTDFQQRVWRRLQSIPYGETITYGQIASEIG